jgi:hypothetical protein
MKEGIQNVVDRIREVRKQIYLLECEIDDIGQQEVRNRKIQQLVALKQEMNDLLKVRDGKSHDNKEEKNSEQSDRQQNATYEPDDTDLSYIPDEEDTGNFS